MVARNAQISVRCLVFMAWLTNEDSSFLFTLSKFTPALFQCFCPVLVVNLCFDSSFCLTLKSAPFFLSPSQCPTFQSLTSKNCQILPCHSLPIPSSTQRWSLICMCAGVCVCVSVVLVFAGGPSNPGSPPTRPSVYPAAHSLPNTAAALPLNQQVMRWKVASTLSLSLSFSLLQFICVQPLCWLIAYCFCWQLRLVPEQPNKSVIHRRAVCTTATAKQSTALGFMAGLSTLE